MAVTRITPWAINGPAANYGLASTLSGPATNVPARALIVTSVQAQTTDATPDQRFGTPTINQALLPANPPSQPTAIAAQKGLQVQAGASAPVDGCWYLLRQPCTTSAGRVVTLKGILQVTSR